MSLETEIRALLGADPITAPATTQRTDEWLAQASKDPSVAEELRRNFGYSPENALNLADDGKIATLPATPIDPPTGHRVRELASKRGKAVPAIVRELVRRGLDHTLT